MNPVFKINYDKLTALKFIAVISMVIDHYNKFLNGGENTLMFAIGRMALPVFLFVLAYNLANIKPDKMPSIFNRLVFFGLLALPVYNALGGSIIWGWWPLNVLFLLAGIVAVVFLLKKPAKTALKHHTNIFLSVFAFLLFGLVAEFWFFGLLLGLALYLLFTLNEKNKFMQVASFASVGLLLVALGTVNGNQWALLSVPLVMLVLVLPVPKLPRCKWFFYWFYPAHLLALWIVKNYI